MSRLAYEAVADEVDYLRARLDRALGYVKVDAPQASPAPAPVNELPVEVSDALDYLGLSGSVRTQMEAWAWRQLDKKQQPKEVAQALIGGGLEEAE